MSTTAATTRGIGVVAERVRATISGFADFSSAAVCISPSKHGNCNLHARIMQLLCTLFAPILAVKASASLVVLSRLTTARGTMRGVPMSKVLRGDDAAVIVVGGGHAGFEAALASARLGVPKRCSSPAIPSASARFACNPSIGGSAKGQLVREIDALGGAMARITDRVSLHARFLNESKGPSVRALRALADKPGYARARARTSVARSAGSTSSAAMVEDLIVEATARCAASRWPTAARCARPTSSSRPGRFSAARPFAATRCAPKAASAKRPRLGLSARPGAPRLSARPSQNRHAAAHRRAPPSISPR
jgi:hypothetical protein